MTILLLSILALMVIIIASRYVAEVYIKHERRYRRFERQYETLYNEIQSDIKCPSTCDRLRDDLRYKLTKLLLLKWKNPEKSRFIQMEYLKKFYSDEPIKLSVHEQIEEINQTRI
jgi:hypothetical protein